jgi:hypothetical protein
MKRTILLALAICATSFGAASLTGCKTHDEDGNMTKSTKMYTCPMHPEVIQDTAGNCPKCGMKLKKQS